MGEERARSRIGGTGNRTIKRKNVVGGARNGAKRPEVRWVGPEMQQWRTEQVGGAGNGAIKTGSGGIKAGNGGGGRKWGRGEGPKMANSNLNPGKAPKSWKLTPKMVGNARISPQNGGEPKMLEIHPKSRESFSEVRNPKWSEFAPKRCGN